MKAIPEEPVFLAWNQFRSQRNSKGVWKGCAVLDGFTKSTIRAAVKAHGGSERVLKAIANYHEIWHGKDYKWTYAWTLCQFLTRKKDGIPQIRRFLPDNFRADDYLKESIVKKRAAIERAEAVRNRYDLQPLKEVPPEPRLDGRRAKLIT